MEGKNVVVTGGLGFIPIVLISFIGIILISWLLMALLNGVPYINKVIGAK